MKTAWTLLKDTFSVWSEDRCPRLGAALAFYSIFSIAPVLVIAIGIAGVAFGEQAARGEIGEQIKGTIGEPAATAIQDLLKHTNSTGGGTLATMIGLSILLLGASGVFLELQDALNTVWKVKPKPGRTILRIIRERFLSFSVVLATGFLLLVSLAVSAALSALADWLTPESIPGGAFFWLALNFLISLVFITVLFGLIFKVLPDVQLGWRDVWIGALATALLFSLGKFLIGLYLGQSTTASAYGAAGSFVIVLLWVYYSSQILLLGAEFTRVWTRWRGVEVRPRPNAEFLECTELERQGIPQTDGRGDGRTDGVRGPHSPAGARVPQQPATP